MKLYLHSKKKYESLRQIAKLTYTTIEVQYDPNKLECFVRTFYLIDSMYYGIYGKAI